MPGPDALVAAPAALALLGSLFAYGPAPGMELIPYFLGLLAWIGVAVAAVVWAPVAAVLRRMRGPRGTAPTEPPPAPVSTPESPGDGRHERS